MFPKTRANYGINRTGRYRNAGRYIDLDTGLIDARRLLKRGERYIAAYHLVPSPEVSNASATTKLDHSAPRGNVTSGGPEVTAVDKPQWPCLPDAFAFGQIVNLILIGALIELVGNFAKAHNA